MRWENSLTDTVKSKSSLVQQIIAYRRSGLNFKQIAYKLKELNIKTGKGINWANSKVFSVLKRFREQKERLELINREYEPEWGKFEVRYYRN